MEKQEIGRLIELACKEIDSAGEMEGVWFGLDTDEVAEFEKLRDKWFSEVVKAPFIPLQVLPPITETGVHPQHGEKYLRKRDT